MKNLFPIIAGALAVGCLPSSADAAILYRGRLTQNVNSTTQFDAGTTYKMTFRVYDLPQGGNLLGTFAIDSVPVRTDGGFEALLDSTELDAKLNNEARTVYVGLSLESERELMPRRQILALPRVYHAAIADKPGYAPQFDEMSADSLNAKKVTVDTLNVAGTLTTKKATDSLSIRGLTLAKTDSLDVSKRSVKALGDVTMLASGIASANAGDTLATAPADGLAYIYTDTSSATIPSIGGVTRFCRRGEAILAPVSISGGETLAVRFYSFLVK